MMWMKLGVRVQGNMPGLKRQTPHKLTHVEYEKVDIPEVKGAIWLWEAGERWSRKGCRNYWLIGIKLDKRKKCCVLLPRGETIDNNNTAFYTIFSRRKNFGSLFHNEMLIFEKMDVYLDLNILHWTRVSKQYQKHVHFLCMHKKCSNDDIQKEAILMIFLE